MSAFFQLSSCVYCESYKAFLLGTISSKSLVDKNWMQLSFWKYGSNDLRAGSLKLGRRPVE